MQENTSERDGKKSSAQYLQDGRGHACVGTTGYEAVVRGKAVDGKRVESYRWKL
jgi:hypothetical protein